MMIKAPTWQRLSFSVVFSVLLLSVSSDAPANALLNFSDTLKSFRASFTQTVYDADSVVLQESTGVVVLARPGRFKWTYDAPVNQVIVADGLTLWVYDEEIKQVTKQPQSTTLGSAPIGLLSGQRDIESEFVITELGKKDDLEWFQLQPLVSDTDFNEIFLALRAGGLHAMELRDNFDQATQIVFDNFEKNIALESDQFTFVVPEGVDVVGEGGVPETQDDLLNDDDLQTDEAPTDEGQPGQEQSDESDPVTDAPATNEQPIQTDPLLIDDSDPVPAVTDAVPQAPSVTRSADVNPTGAGTVNPLPNSDEELLGEELPGDAEPADESDVGATTETVEAPLETPAGSDNAPVTETPATDTPAIDTADPSREITFEEQKVN